MFKGLGSLMSVLSNPGKLREQAEAMQQRLGTMVADGDAGGGMVKFRISGRGEVLSCTLSDEVAKLNDKEMLEDLIRSAANVAIQKARRLAAEEAAKMAGEWGVPPGMMENLPGMPGGPG
jgi:DNA-binding YbaB/EbfC family protein